MGFDLLIFLTSSSSATRSTWPNQRNICILINPITFYPFLNSFISWLVLILQLPSSNLVGPKYFPHDRKCTHVHLNSITSLKSHFPYIDSDSVFYTYVYCWLLASPDKSCWP
jgi:hypothetical protein